MRMICDVLRPTRGGHPPRRAEHPVYGERYRDLLGYLPQDFGYYPTSPPWTSCSTWRRSGLRKREARAASNCSTK